MIIAYAILGILFGAYGIFTIIKDGVDYVEEWIMLLVLVAFFIGGILILCGIK